MGHPRSTEPLRSHPAVDAGNIRSLAIYGSTKPSVQVTCPTCRAVRWYPIGTLRQLLKKAAFTGDCRPCWLAKPKKPTFRTRRNPSGRRTAPNGYVMLGKNAIPDVDLPLFDAMRGLSGSVAEHRWVMAKFLGRPLTSEELVDHMDGDKTNNAASNLRIYVRGKQQPGSAPGHGTYYHEWQMAKRRVRELEAALAVRG